MKTYDLIILGGGSAGFSAAMAALELKKTVCMVEQGPFGGLCILRGCMPSKTIIHSARILHLIKKAKEVGVNFKGKTVVDVAHIIDRKNKIIKGFADYRLSVVEKKKIDIVYGKASFVNSYEIAVGNKKIGGKNFLISTGSTPFVPNIAGLKEAGCITSDEALELKKLPKSMAVLGGGAIAVELAYYFNHLGVETTIIQRSSQILSRNDDDCAEELQKSLIKQGIKIFADTKLIGVKSQNSQKEIIFEKSGSKKSVIVEEILAAFGRIPNTKNLNLEKIDVKLEKGTPINNKFLQTTQNHIYVAGDVSGNQEVVNVAVEEGKQAVENMFGKKKALDYSLFPKAVFSHPEFAWIGVTEKEAKEKNLDVKIGRLPYTDLGKAVCIDETEGFIKFIVDKKTNRILGVSIVGHEASDLISEAIPLLYFKATLQDLAKMPHLHPSFGEIYSYLVDEMV